MSRWFEILKEKNNSEDPIMPIRSTEFSAGYDFFAPINFSLEPGEKKIVWTDITARMEGDEVFLIFPRSSLGIKKGVVLANTVGIIDADYNRNIGLPLSNQGDEIVDFTRGEDKLVQGIFTKYLPADNCNFDETRVGGMGSTNK